MRRHQARMLIAAAGFSALAFGVQPAHAIASGSFPIGSRIGCVITCVPFDVINNCALPSSNNVDGSVRDVSASAGSSGTFRWTSIAVGPPQIWVTFWSADCTERSTAARLSGTSWPGGSGSKSLTVPLTVGGKPTKWMMVAPASEQFNINWSF